MMRKIAVITGTRADYGSYYPILKKLQADKDLSLEIIATGMHLSPQYGYTIDEIEKDGFKIKYKVDMLLSSDSGAAMAKNIGLGILGITNALEIISPDILLVLGDRGEMLAGTIAAAHMNIPVFHLHGGEVTGTIDESIRHAITKLAHIHLVATDKYGERIAKLGEDVWRIHVFGAPRADIIQHTEFLTKEEILKKYDLRNLTEYNLLVFHPVTTEINLIEEQINNIIKALEFIKIPTIIILPNSDAGNHLILNVYNKYRNNQLLYFFANVNHFDYLSLLKNTIALIGNSSSGIIEAPLLKKAAINIGSRQFGRERSSNVIDVNAVTNEIVSAYLYSQSPEFQQIVLQSENIYGDGTTSDKVINLLKNIEINYKLIQKKITY